MNEFKVIGLMSGTSLDGLDIAACGFYVENHQWKFKIYHAKTIPYDEGWKNKLKDLHLKDAFTYALANVEFGHLLGRSINSFMADTGFNPDLIASHGHTVFHRPDLGFTSQIGCGSAIAAETGFPVVFDFRSLDLALGGQGAPLVPVGDKYLFGEYDACLNLGGFANISMDIGSDRIAYDICPVNFVLNRLAGELGLDYDKDGQLARRGVIDPDILERLNVLDYYSVPYPKSLGREWVEAILDPILAESSCTPVTLLRTFTEHIAIQVNNAAGNGKLKSILVTGGGAKNKFLMERIRSSGINTWKIPDELIVDYKEALVFAFLGMLRHRKDVNTLHSVTGSRMDNCGGAHIYIR